MTHSTGRFALAAVALVLSTSGVGRAEPSWSYTWERGPAVIAADQPGTGGISLAPFATATVTGSRFIQASTFTTFSSASTEPDHFTHGAYFLTLHLTDLTSRATDAVTFRGEFDGALTATSSSLAHTFTGALSQTVTLGDYDYKVTIGLDPVLPAPDSTVVTTLGAQVDVSAHDGGQHPGNIVSTPEPPTCLLALLAVPVLALGWRKGKRPAQAS